ncbi:hypothetical protein JD844_000940, partial [Phrynosoma platyrhinos]
ATAQLKEALKQPQALSHLSNVMSNCQDSRVRILEWLKSLVLTTLQKETEAVKFHAEGDGEAWVVSRTRVQAAISPMPSIFSSSHKVSLGLAQLAAVILKNETLEKWPQMLQIIQHGARSRDPIQCQVTLRKPPKPSCIPFWLQVGLLLLHSALELDPEAFAPHYKDLLRLFHQTLNIRGQPAALYYSLRSLSTMAAGLGSDEMIQASEAMEVFDELMETEVSIISQHVTEIVGFCLEIASNQALGDSLRVKALSCISFLIKLRSKVRRKKAFCPFLCATPYTQAILKHKLLSPILTTLFPIMSAEPPPGQMDAEDEQTEEDIEERAEVQTPKHYAAQVLSGFFDCMPFFYQVVDMLALHLPPEKLFPQLVSMKNIEGEEQQHLQPMLQVVCRALLDESQVVRNAALFALGQFSENLQPDIANYSDDIMPLILRYLEGVQVAHTSHMAKAYYALENFVENLGENFWLLGPHLSSILFPPCPHINFGDKIAPYLPSLMERMLTTLSLPGSPRTKELAVSAIGAIAQAAQDSIMPYFQAIVEHLMGYLLTTQEDLRPVQIQSVETLSVLATVLNKEVFLPLAEQCCQLGLDLCDRVDDPDLRRCTMAFLPYMENCFQEIGKLLESLTSCFCSSAPTSGYGNLHLKPWASSVSPFIGSVSGIRPSPTLQVCGHRVEELLIPTFPSALQKLLSMVMPVYIKGIREDKERQVVMAILEMLAKMVKSCQKECLREPGRLAELCRVIREVLEKKVSGFAKLQGCLAGYKQEDTACQDSDVDEDGDEDDEEEAEYDAMLIEYAGEVIPALAEAAGGETFAPYFAGLLPLLLNKMKPSSSFSDKSFAVGTMAETIQGLGQASSAFVPRLLPLLMGAARDVDKEVRSNAVFGLGVLAEHGGQPMHEHYPKLLGLLSNIISQEQNSRVADNVCGAVARMVIANPGGVPIGQVFPVLLHALPLKEDYEEYQTIFRCINFIHKHDPQQVLQQVGEIVRASSTVLGNKHVPTGLNFEGAIYAAKLTCGASIPQ